MKQLWLVFFALLSGCTSVPDKVVPVQSFDSQRYLGRWYEIARLDHSFERGLDHVSAEYSRNDDGSIRVVNRGYAPEKQVWKEAIGKAKFVRQADEGYLKVSFFGPFYGSYIIFDLDKTHYQYSLIAGPDHGYLWILSRSPTLPDDVKQQLVQKALLAGFDTRNLIWVKH